MRFDRPVVLVAAAAASVIATASPQARPLERSQVPAELQPWIGWALHGSEAERCPTQHGEEDRRCVWPARLVLEVGAAGGRFTQDWYLDDDARVVLPGDAERWPHDVRVDGRPAVVTSQDARPSVQLTAGAHTVAGRFTWGSTPDSLAVPAETGLLSLKVDGAARPFPQRDADGTVWLQGQATEAAAEARLDLTVHRQVVDDVPLQVHTRIELDVAGESREELLGRALLDGLEPMAIESDLPARLEPDGRLRVQVRPGRWVITLTGRAPGRLDRLTLKDPGEPWAPSEVWVFEARPALRLVDVEGKASIDPQQTRLPDAWKRLPAYPMTPGDELRLVERRRGDSDPAPDMLGLRRSWWLDFDGGGYTVRDEVTGAMNRGWRLEMAPPLTLGRVAVDGRDQLITRLDGSEHAGVELRNRTLEVLADGRLDAAARSVPAVGWDHDFHSVSGQLHVPPGWRVLHVGGVDDATPTWLRSWQLLDVFLVLMIALAAFTLWDWRWGLLALVTLVLCYPEAGAPQWIWLVVIAVEALVRALPEGRLQRLTKAVRLVAIVVLAAIAIPFMVQQVRVGMYPALAQPWRAVGTDGGARRIESDRSRFADLVLDGAAGGLAEQAPSPQAPPFEADEAQEFKKSEGKAKLRKSKIALSQLVQSQGSDSRSVDLYQVPVDANVQTGPGMPSWGWETVDLAWSGPVDRAARVSLVLLSPGWNLVLALVRVLLLALLALGVAGMADDRRKRLLSGLLGRGGATVASVLVLAGALVVPGPARAEVPSQEVLNTLRQRLLEPPSCLPDCASSARMRLQARGRTLTLQLEVEAAADTAVPLPGGDGQWTPTTVLLDGRQAAGLATGDSGQLWLRVAAGRHQVVAAGPLPHRDTVQIALPLKPHRVEHEVEGWTLEGVREGLAADHLQLVRVRQEEDGEASALQAETLPPFVRVDRRLQLGLAWEVETRVTRLTPPGSAVVLQIPLLPGESVTTADLRVEAGKVALNMAPTQGTVVWRSVLEQRSPVALVAPEATPWTEEWIVEAAPIWNVSVVGIPTIHSDGGPALTWRPWPGERVELTVTRPGAVPGRTLTIDDARVRVEPGARATDATLSLTLRSSRGGQHALTLPEGATVQSVEVAGRSQPIRQDGQTVTVPVLPGTQSVELAWRDTRGITTRFATPAVGLGAPSVNTTIDLQVPRDRWTLFVSLRPGVGPAVLFWSMLAVLLLASIVLGRLSLSPLRTHEWFLLGLGLTQSSVWVALVIAGWLLALSWRRRRPDVTWAWFDLRQLVLAAWTAVALVLLIWGVEHGLLGYPEMQISGNGCGPWHLRWFQDRSPDALPQAWVLSVSIWWYRGAMLAWAAWLVLAVVRWLRWGWGSFGEGGLWLRRPPKVAPSAPGKAPEPEPGPEAPSTAGQ